MIKVKICGLKRDCDIEYANQLKPDYVGFVFADYSSRFISPELAVVMRCKLSTEINAVGVIVNLPLQKAARIVGDSLMDLVQLHGDEDDNYILRLRELTGKPIIKAFRVDSESDLSRAASSSADYVLFDSGSGGTGKTFDWSLIAQIERPYFLAGGLNPQNVETAVEKLHPYAVDTSSGVETGGHKDFQKIKSFIDIIRGK